MHSLKLLLILPVLVLAGCGKTLSPDEARGLLRQVQAARKDLSLQGQVSTSVRIRDQLVQAEAQVIRAPGLVQVQYQTGRFAGWRVYEQDGKVWRLDPQGKAHPSPAGAEGDSLGLPLTPRLTVHYDGFGLVSRRRVMRYTISPGNAGGARLTLALDISNSFPLVYERYGMQGQLLSATTYRRVDYTIAAPQRVAVPPEATSRQSAQGKGGHARPATAQELAGLLNGPVARPKYIPEGFQYRGLFLHETARRQFAELRYSDGLRPLAVIQFKAPAAGERRRQAETGNTLSDADRRGQKGERRATATDREPGLGVWQRLIERRGKNKQAAGQEPRAGQGRSVLRGNVMRERRGDRVVVVVGELRDAELKKVMDSIPPVPGQTRPAVHF